MSPFLHTVPRIAICGQSHTLESRQCPFPPPLVRIDFICQNNARRVIARQFHFMKLFDHQCAACDGTGEDDTGYYGVTECHMCDGLGAILTEEGEQIKSLIYAVYNAIQRDKEREKENVR